MTSISQEIGRNIHNYRKKQHMTQEQLASAISRSKTTLCKYENGTIVMDIETLYEIASALHVHVEELLYQPPVQTENTSMNRNTAFLAGLSQFYSYLYDGRTRKLIRCVFDITGDYDENRKNVRLYMNFSDYENYRQCETTYYGYLENFDTLTNIILTNQDSSMEKASAHILASYQNTDTKWGLFNGISSRPVMPISVKMLFSRTRLEENQELMEKLMVNKEDIRLLKLYNMMAVME